MAPRFHEDAGPKIISTNPDKSCLVKKIKRYQNCGCPIGPSFGKTDRQKMLRMLLTALSQNSDFVTFNFKVGQLAAEN